MMERRCDRCHALIPDNEYPDFLRIMGMEFTLNDYGNVRGNVHFRKYGDLCKVCAKDFLEWIHGDDRQQGEST